MEATADTLLQHVLVFIVAACFASFISWIAYKEGFFTLPIRPPSAGRVGFSKVFGAFGLFLAMELVVVPTLYLLWVSFQQGHLIIPEKIQLNPQTQGWVNMAAILGTVIALSLYFFSLDRATRQEIWGEAHMQTPSWSVGASIYNLFFGAFTWFVAYPWILTISQGIGILLLLKKAESKVDQIAVKHVKEAMSHPIQLIIMVVAVVIVVPILEELLFRGFLQAWLKKLMGWSKAVFLVSIIFALFHFSTSQGAENFELLPALFVLSCFLGFLRERQRSLWASIGLHSTFNLISVTLILITAGK